jgi:Rps23 Pro-64 3,4-dihydroxylase Tpa1-like proline 4-hydroxylase
MIDLERIASRSLSSDPYKWAFIDSVFTPADAATLVNTFPRDHFKTVKGYDGEKGYEYEARSLIAMGANVATHDDALSPAWQNLAVALVSPGYRKVMSRLTGLELENLPIEVNLFHYGKSAWLGPHVDLEDKLVTHVFYFNESWEESDGGCLAILRGGDMGQVAQLIPPIVGNSAVLVRSTKSWHAVTRVRDDCRVSRRSLALTFYRPGSASTMWPDGDKTPLHNYNGEHSTLGRRLRGWMTRLTR